MSADAPICAQSFATRSSVYSPPWPGASVPKDCATEPFTTESHAGKLTSISPGAIVNAVSLP